MGVAIADLRGRKSRERQVYHVATPETIRKLDNVTIDRLYANGFLRAEHVDAWLEIHDAWKALSRGLGMRLMRFGERTAPSKGELSTRQEQLIKRYSEWRDVLLREKLHIAGEVIVASIEGHSLDTMGPFGTMKRLLKNGLEEYCKANGMY